MGSPVYAGPSTLREARQVYFDAYDLGEGGYTSKWVELQRIAGIPIGFPNSPGRIRAVKLHDLHHVLTGYAADWLGEAEIAAWEVGAGCGRHYAAWVLNLFAMQYGIVLAPRRVARAFARGRRSASLYGARELDEAMLDRSVSEVRSELGLDRSAPAPSFVDIVALAGWTLAGAAIWTTPILLAAGALFALFGR
jgi:hypothetical protein